MTPDDPAQFGIYVHWPYCARICPYCDFNVVRERGREAETSDLIDSIVRDLVGHGEMLGDRKLASIFFGGGTPSLMSPTAIARIIDVAKGLWTPATNLEISLEANPTDAEGDRFLDIAAAGVGRLSLGVQSFDDRDLIFLGRNHDSRAAREAVRKAQAAFPRLSIDLIYALPDQSIDAWREQLEAVVATGCEHISAYQLSIEPGAAFSRAVRRGTLRPASDDLAADLFEITQQTLANAGFDAYEVSNHARRRDARSRHNLIYWRGGDYVGAGPGAHGRLTMGGLRVATKAPDRVGDYIKRVRDTGTGSVREPLSPRDAVLERLVMGLRTDEGVAIHDIEGLAPSSNSLVELDAYLEVSAHRVIAKPTGRLVLDRVVAELVSGLDHA